MKRTLAIILALCMVFALFACAPKETPPADTSTPTPPPAADASTPAPVPTPAPAAPAVTPNPDSATGADDEQPLDKVGFYDPNFNYAAGQKYKVQYMVISTSVLYEQFDTAFAQWASMFNMDYGHIWAAGGDSELFINNISTFAGQGVNGLLLDPDLTTYPRIAEVLGELNVQWMPCMGAPRDVTLAEVPLLHPAVGKDYYEFGRQMTLKLIDYKNTAWPDVPLEDCGYIFVDFSVSAPIHDRERGAHDLWLELTGLEDNYMVADCATGQLDMDTSYKLVNAYISTDDRFSHWLIAGAIDDLAQGAATALDTLGLTDKGVTLTVGLTAIEKRWDLGNQDAWRFSYATAHTINAEPIIGALYAFMSGQATPDNLWPSWVDVNDHGLDGHTYAKLLLPSYWISIDNYKEFYEWTDVYSGANIYAYDNDVSGITRDTFASRQPVPESYHIPR